MPQPQVPEPLLGPTTEEGKGEVNHKTGRCQNCGEPCSPEAQLCRPCFRAPPPPPPPLPPPATIRYMGQVETPIGPMTLHAEGRRFYLGHPIK